MFTQRSNLIFRAVLSQLEPEPNLIFIQRSNLEIKVNFFISFELRKNRSCVLNSILEYNKSKKLMSHLLFTNIKESTSSFLIVISEHSLFLQFYHISFLTIHQQSALHTSPLYDASTSIQLEG